MPINTFENTFEPLADDRRVIYACGKIFFFIKLFFLFLIENPWVCDNRLEWFQQLLRNNLDIDIDKPGCVATCESSSTNCSLKSVPLRDANFCLSENDQPLPLSGTALSVVGWIILG